MADLRVAFLGNDPWSVSPLEALADAPSIDVALVITNPPRPAGRGSKPTPTAVARAARARGLPLLETEGVRSGEGLSALLTTAPHVVVVVAHGELLTRDVLGVPPLGAVNLHFSLLPRWRGAAPVQRAILAGDATTGVTVMLMDEGLDTGPVLASLEEPISPDDDAGALGSRLARNGAPLLAATLVDLEAGSVSARPQDERGVTFAPRMRPEERRLDWTDTADALGRRVRSLAPDPGATTDHRGHVLKVLAARPVEAMPAERGRAPGTVTGADRDGVGVATGDGVLTLLEVAPSGRKRMPAADWARGARFEPDERLG